MLIQAGQVGLILLLYEVGLEIDLPGFGEFRRAIVYALGWCTIQYPFVILLAHAIGLGLKESLLAAAALTGCSVGMAHIGWKGYPGSGAAKRFLLHVMVALEMIAIVLLTTFSSFLEKPLGWWLPLNLLGIGTIIWLISRLAVRVQKLFDRILQVSTHWQVHLIVLLVLAICAAGERLGLSAVKTAFFLGLFMSRSQHEGYSVEEAIAPISRRFLIPLFFVSLGLHIEWRFLITTKALFALGTALFIIGWRSIIHRRWLPTGGGQKAFMLLGPNLPLVALGASVLLERADCSPGARWLLLCGFFLSVISIISLPASPQGTESGFQTS